MWERCHLHHLGSDRQLLQAVATNLWRATGRRYRRGELTKRADLLQLGLHIYLFIYLIIYLSYLFNHLFNHLSYLFTIHLFNHLFIYITYLPFILRMC
jgi:hypothetical protein